MDDRYLEAARSCLFASAAAACAKSSEDAAVAVQALAGLVEDLRSAMARIDPVAVAAAEAEWRKRAPRWAMLPSERRALLAGYAALSSRDDALYCDHDEPWTLDGRCPLDPNGADLPLWGRES